MTGVHVATEDGKTSDADVLLVAVGRGPVTEGLATKKLVSRWSAAVLTNERLQYRCGQHLRSWSTFLVSTAHCVSARHLRGGEIAGLSPR